MIQTKYIIIFGILVCLIVIFLLYKEISKTKNTLMPAYNKTMALEAKLEELSKNIQKNVTPVPRKNNDSPVYSITYQSDMMKNGNLSVKYTDLNDSEAAELLKKMAITNNNNNCKLQNKCNTNSNNTSNKPQIHTIKLVDDKDFTDFMNVDEVSNIKINDLLLNDPANDCFSDYQQILTNPNISCCTSANDIDISEKSNICNDSDELDTDVVKSISESIKYADLPSENELSDFPSSCKYKSRDKKSQNRSKSHNNNFAQ